MRHLHQLQSIRRLSPGVLRALGLGLLLTGAALGLGRATGAGPDSSDPVDELRRAIKLDRGASLDPLNREAVMKERRTFREKNLTAKADRVISLGDLARAMMLLEWDYQE